VPEIDHDRLFKELLTTFFVEFVQGFLPDVAAYLDPDTIEFLDKEVFTDVTQGDRYESDIVVRARFRERPAFFLILVENQSSPQSRFPKRMFTYFARFHEKFDLPIMPVVLYSFDVPRKRQASLYRIEFPGFVVNQFRFRVIQLNRLKWRDYVAQPNPAATALMTRMQIASRDRPKVKVQCLRLIATLRLDPARSQLIAGFMHSYLKLTGPEQRIFERELGEVPSEERETMLTLTNEWIEQGIERGIEQGIEQGELRAERAVIFQLGTKRFGEPDRATRAALETADIVRLKTLIERLLDVKSWQELLRN
jgi:hypothetical protein